MKEILSIKDIRQDITLQPRAKMDSAIIAEYTESIKAGDKFPPVIVYNVSGEFYLVDGYHRIMALKSAKITKAEVDIRTGTMRDATLFSAGVNSEHGIRRTHEDKNRAVMILLRDPEWKEWANAEIARACKVSAELVSKIRESILPKTDRCRTDTPEPTPEKRKVKRAGKVFTMDTSKIGKTEPKKQDPAECFSPQPGSIPVTDAPAQPSFAEFQYLKEYPVTAACLQKNCDQIIKQKEGLHLCKIVGMRPENISGGCPRDAVLIKDELPSQPRKAPCMSGQPCPDGKDHKSGNKCALHDKIIGQFFKDECYLDARARKEAEREQGGEQLHRASGLNVPPKSTQPLPFIKPKISKEELDNAIEAFLILMPNSKCRNNINECLEETPTKTRADVIDAALDVYVVRRR